MSKNNEPEELETLDNEQQQDNSDLNENDSNELLDDDNDDNEYNPEVTEDIENDSEYHNHNKIIPPEYNDQEFDSLSKTEQNKIVRNNIISVIAFFIFFLIIFQIIL